MTRRTATTTQVIAIHGLLAKHLTQWPNEPYWKYEDDWNDGRIALETGAPLAAVQRTRHENFGPLKKMQAAEMRAARFAEYRKKLESELSDIRARLNRIELVLKLQHGVAVPKGNSETRPRP